MHCAKCFFYESDVGDDVCRRCGRAFMPEANVYLGLLLLATGGLAWLLKAMLTGSADPLVRPDLGLGGWVTQPVSVVDYPSYGLVLGAWLAMLAATPVLAAVLFGKRGGWVLCIIIALLGPSLPLAAAAAVGVWLAAGYRVQIGSKLASGVLGLVPSAIAWFVLTWRSETDLPTTLAPMRFVPALAAVVTGAGAVAVVVGVGRADRWHVRWPGVILGLLTAGPVMGLVAFVGVDTIRYEMLPSPTSAELGPVLRQYRRFLDRYPDSPLAVRVRADLATALEQAETRDRPTPASAPSAAEAWQAVLENHPESPWAIDARLELADRHAAAGRFDHAETLYTKVLRGTGGVETAPEDPLNDFTLLRGYFTIGEERRVHRSAQRLRPVRRQAMRRLGLLRENRGLAAGGDRSLALFFKALNHPDARRYREARANIPDVDPDYREALLAARRAEPEGPIADNVAAELAALEKNPETRIEKLLAVAEAHPETDGAMRARRLAAETIVALPKPTETQLATALEALKAVRAALDQRRRARADDPYVLALADVVEKKIAYVQSLRKQEDGA